MKFFYQNNPQIKFYREFFLQYNHQGISLWPSLAPSVYYYQHHKTYGGTFSKILRILKFLFFVETFDLSKTQQKTILATFLIDRKDHHDLWTKALSAFSKTDNLSRIDSFQKGARNIGGIARRFRPHIPRFNKILRIATSLQKKNTRQFFFSFLDYWYFVLNTYYQTKKIDYWKPIIDNLQPEKYISYSSYRNNDETIITQLCNKKKIPTLTFQNYNIPQFKTFNYESITCENFISNQFLVWGNSTKKLLEKYYPKNRIVLAGNPLYEKSLRKKITIFSPKKGTIFISHPSYKKGNEELLESSLELAKRYPSITFQFNVHPDNDEEEYAQKVKNSGLKNVLFLYNKNITKDELLQNADFFIVYNSTIVLEVMAKQTPLLRYKNEDSTNMPVPSLNFSNTAELTKSFSTLFNKQVYKKHIKDCYNSYNESFYQPTKKTIPENYKKLISSATYLLS